MSLQISAEVSDLIGEVDELFSQKDKEREEISFSPFSISDDDDREPLLWKLHTLPTALNTVNIEYIFNSPSYMVYYLVIDHILLEFWFRHTLLYK